MSTPEPLIGAGAFGTPQQLAAFAVEAPRDVGADALPPSAIGPAWIEVDLDAIAWNVARVREAVAPALLCAVVKADGYGHGAVEVARTAMAAGAGMLAVSTIPEALELRAAGIDAPVLVLTPLFSARAAELVVDAALTPTIVHLDVAHALSRAADRPVPIHIKVETGMGRYGVTPGELSAFLDQLGALPRLRLEGVYTHFACPGEAARRQLRTFLAAIDGRSLPLRHAAASPAVLTLPEADLDMVRVGNLIYGLKPLAGGRPLNLRPAWRLRAAVAQVKLLPRGARVGYGSTFKARRPTLAATLPVGFADGIGLVPATRLERPGPLLHALGRALLRLVGLERLLGPALGAIEINGRQAPLLGRMSMQQATVDVTAIPGVTAGSVATVHCRPTAASARLSRVFLRDGVAWRARTVTGSVALDGREPLPFRQSGRHDGG